MELGLRDKVVIVTGANAGIGLATVRLFLEEGAKVVGASRSLNALNEIGSDRLVTVAGDLSTPEGNDRMIEKAIEAFGKIDVLVNNMGIVQVRNGFLSISDEDWNGLLEANFMSMVRASRAAIPYMLKQNSGVIINIASEVGRQPDSMIPDYSVSKTAMLSLSKALSNEFGPKGIRVNAVSPGSIRTPLWDNPGGFADSLAANLQMNKDDAIAHYARNLRKLPLERLGTAEEVASVIAFLASDQASFVTGSEFMVNGGSLKEI
ncbi:SDR family NAD(P)-dependent oxidoreductase [Paenibacillus abyssi]|uniref:3-oxoacyl-ACP reductase n=1 Tax=Paenibacillus abyssi TaxID=1340531 RepID=A0A917FS26_9BACL|nr:SDR family oxidoreductase [Paenibacillus abyssi]GGG02994.1 3-oxoacyl-ACP reductase [Paenibacillus abyssi]